MSKVRDTYDKHELLINRIGFSLLGMYIFNPILTWLSRG